MNYHEFMKSLLVLSCIGSNVFAALHAGAGGGGGGYQYRPGGGFNDNSVDFGRGSNFGGGFRNNPSALYGAPGFGSGDGSGGQAFGRGPSQNYGTPSQNYGAPSQNYGTPSQNYGTPSTNYGAPGYANGGRRNQGGYNDDQGRPQPYSFQYQVYDPPSGNDYSQRESSDGNVVQGEYRVLLPDSRTQIVKYTADDVNGYNADVQYEGQPQYQQGGGRFGQGGTYGNDAANNQYLPPRGNYRK